MLGINEYLLACINYVKLVSVYHVKLLGLSVDIFWEASQKNN